MTRRLLVVSAIVLALYPAVRAEERHLDFVYALRDQGYYDTAIEYLRGIAGRADLPAPIKDVLDYEIGELLLLQATDERDLVKRDQQLEDSRVHLQRFVDAHANHARAPGAMTDLALILVERGRVAVMQSNSPAKRAQRPEFQQQARDLFGKARTQFQEAEKQFLVEYKKFPSYIDPNNPRSKQQIEDRREAHLNLMQAQLNLAVIEYEYAQSFDRETKEFKDTLNLAVKKFEDVYKNYREWLAGLYARMWMGKCFEEMGDIRKAVGFYEELEKHEDPKLAPLQRQVTYFHIICMNKRGDHVLAQQTAERWISQNLRLARSKQGLGVSMELAAALRDQAKKLDEKDSQRNRLLGQASSIWNDVARFEGEFKELALQEKAKWGVISLKRDRLLNYDEALTLAERAREESKWAEAVEAYEIALAAVTDKQETSQINKTRYLYAFCLYQMKRYLSAGVIAQHIAVRHPDSGLALNAAYIALASFAQSHAAAKPTEQPEVERLQIDRIGQYIESRWPDTPEADFARLVLAGVAQQRQEHAAAAAAFERVSPKSEDYLSSQTKAGEAYWNAYLAGLDAPAAGQTQNLQTYLKKAGDLLSKTRDDRQKKLNPSQPVPEDNMRADLFLAQIYLEGGRDKDSITLLEPLVKTVGERKDLAHLELATLTAAMQGYVRLENLDQAEAMMGKIEATGKDTAEITALFQSLATQLRQKMERLEKLGDKAGAEQTRKSFLAFLDRLSKRQAGQTFDSLNWIAASFFGLGAYDHAERLFREIITKFASDAGVAADAKKRRALTVTRLQLVTALRLQKKYTEALTTVEAVFQENKKAVDVIVEYGRALSWSATETPQNWDLAIKHWRQYANYLGLMRPKPPQYFECWLYLGACRIGKVAASPGAQAQEFALAAKELNYLYGTMAESDRQRTLDDTFADLRTFAAQVAGTQAPPTLGALCEALLTKAGAAPPRAQTAAANR
jgi:hypothetical protein